MIRSGYGLLVLAFAALPLSLGAQEAPPPGACHVGAYAMADGSSLVISPSDAPNLRYRSLDGASGRLYPVSETGYESGEGWSVREPVTLHVEFGACGEGRVRV